MDTDVKSSKSTGQASKDFGTSEPSTNQNSNALDVFAEVLTANLSQLPAKERELKMKGTYGQSSEKPFAKLNQDGRWLKMSQGYYQSTLEKSLVPFSQTWPRWGMMRGGEASELPIAVRPYREKESSLWPSPRKEMSHGHCKSRVENPELAWGERRLEDVVAVSETQSLMWPSPTSATKTGGIAMCKWGGSGTRKKLKKMVSKKELNGALSPHFTAWLMGFPLDWTWPDWEMNTSEWLKAYLKGLIKYNHSATQSSHKSQSSSEIASCKQKEKVEV